jgi:hypothetical protein
MNLVPMPGRGERDLDPDRTRAERRLVELAQDWCARGDGDKLTRHLVSSNRAARRSSAGSGATAAPFPLVDDFREQRFPARDDDDSAVLLLDQTAQIRAQATA